MKIIGINAEHSKSERNVAFVVEGSLDAEVVGAIRLGSLQLRVEGELLRAQAQENYDVPSITSQTVAAIEQNYKTHADAKETKRQRAEQEHQAVIQRVSRNTGLDVK